MRKTLHKRSSTGILVCYAHHIHHCCQSILRCGENFLLQWLTARWNALENLARSQRRCHPERANPFRYARVRLVLLSLLVVGRIRATAAKRPFLPIRHPFEQELMQAQVIKKRRWASSKVLRSYGFNNPADDVTHDFGLIFLSRAGGRGALLNRTKRPVQLTFELTAKLLTRPFAHSALAKRFRLFFHGRDTAC